MIPTVRFFVPIVIIIMDARDCYDYHRFDHDVVDNDGGGGSGGDIVRGR